MNKFFLAAFHVCAAAPAYAGVISTNTYTYADYGSTAPVHALLTVTVLDNVNGDTSRWLWTYTVENIDWDPYSYGQRSGGIGMFFPGTGLGVIHPASNFSPGWDVFDCPSCWFTNGIEPGESQVFSFISPPSTIITQPGFMQELAGHWYPGRELSGTSQTPGTALPAPEPSSITLAGCGLCALLFAMRASSRRP